MNRLVATLNWIPLPGRRRMRQRHEERKPIEKRSKCSRADPRNREKDRTHTHSWLALVRRRAGLWVLMLTASGFSGTAQDAQSPLTPDVIDLSQQYRINQWKTEDGLPQNTVECILQTQDGYLWIGTRIGLAYLSHRFHQESTWSNRWMRRSGGPLRDRPWLVLAG